MRMKMWTEANLMIKIVKNSMKIMRMKKILMKMNKNKNLMRKYLSQQQKLLKIKIKNKMILDLTFLKKLNIIWMIMRNQKVMILMDNWKEMNF